MSSQSVVELLQTLNVIREIEIGERLFKLAKYTLDMEEPERTEVVTYNMRTMPMPGMAHVTPADFITRCRNIASRGPIGINTIAKQICRPDFSGPTNEHCFIPIPMPARLYEEIVEKFQQLEAEAEEKGCKKAAVPVADLMARVMETKP